MGRDAGPLASPRPARLPDTTGADPTRNFRSMSPVLIAALPFLGALLAGLAARGGRSAVTLAAGLCTAAALAGLVLHRPDIAAGQPVTASAIRAP